MKQAQHPSHNSNHSPLFPRRGGTGGRGCPSSANKSNYSPLSPRRGGQGGERLLILFLFLLPTFAHADDTGLWNDITFEKKVTKTFSIDAGFGFRLEQNWSHFTRYDFSLGLGYKPLRYLGFGASYAFIRDFNASEVETKYKDEHEGDADYIRGYNVDESFWRNKHRATFDITGSLPIGRFTLSLRERYQYTFFKATDYTRTRYRSLTTVTNQTDLSALTPYAGQYWAKAEEEERTKKAKHRHYLRSRIGIEYNIRHCAWTPFATYEFSNNLTDGMRLDKQRLTVGAEWKLTKHHRFDFAYVYSNGADDDSNDDIHVISVGYKYKF